MINYTDRLDKALRTAAWAHERAGQHRTNTEIPYIIHPVGAMMIASNVSSDEDVLIACLLHDVLEDVDNSIYDESKMRSDFGDRVVSIVKDVTKDDSIKDWHKRSQAYLDHLEFKASGEAVIVSASDKIHNLKSMIVDFAVHGDKLWDRFSTKSSADQLWWYESMLEVIKRREASTVLINELNENIRTLKQDLQKV